LGFLQEPFQKREPDRLAILSLGVSIAGVLVSVLLAVAVPEVALLALGLIAGLVLGVLASPHVRRLAVWLAAYLSR